MYRFLTISFLLLSITDYGFSQIQKQDQFKLTEGISALKKEGNIQLRQSGFEKLATKLLSNVEYSGSADKGVKKIQPYLEFVKKTENIIFVDTICFNLIIQIEISEANYSLMSNVIEFIIVNDLPLSRTVLTNYYYNLQNTTSTDVKLKRRFVELVKKENNAAGLQLILNYLNDENGDATGYLWSSVEVDLFVKELIKVYGIGEAHKLITSKTAGILRSDTSWTIKQLDFRMFQMERSGDVSTLNAIRSNPRFDVNNKLANQVKNQIENGEYFITGKTYRHFGKILGDLKPDTLTLNRKYEHLVFDINQVIRQKMGLKELRIPTDYFNYKALTGLEKNENPLDIQRIKNGIIYKLSAQFEFSKTVQISNTSIDYLALAYYNLALIRNSKNFKMGLDLSPSLLVNYNMRSDKFHFSRLQTDLPAGSAGLTFSDLNKLWNKIDHIEIKARSYDLINFMVKEDLVVRLLDGKTLTFNYLGNIPYRYYNLLTLDSFIFDVSRFSFAYRELCYLNKVLDRSLVDMVLRNSTDGLGLVLNVLNNKTDLKTFENEMTVNMVASTFDLNKSFAKRPESIQTSEFLAYAASKPAISKMTSDFTNVAPFKNDKLFFSNDSIQATSLKNIFRQGVLTVNYNIIATIYNSWAATQYKRLDIIPTPSDLELLTNKDKGKQVSAKNAQRNNLIKGCLILAEENNKSISNLNRFMLFNPNITSQTKSDMAVVDLSRNKLFNVIKLTAVSSEVSYLFAEVNIDNTLMNRMYYTHKFSPTFFTLFNIDVSDASGKGLNYFLQLEDYQKKEQEFNDKFIYHGIDFEQAYAVKDFEMGNKKAITTDNKLFEISLSLGQNLLLKEKEFVNKFHLPNLSLLPSTLTVFQKYFQNNLQMNDTQVGAIQAKFSESFEPIRDRWNNDWGISVSIGMGQLNFFSFSFGSSSFNLSIPPIHMNNYIPTYTPISML